MGHTPRRIGLPPSRSARDQARARRRLRASGPDHLEPRVVPADLTFASGLLNYTAGEFEGNVVAIDRTVAGGQTYLRFREQGAGVAVGSGGDGLIPDGSRTFRVRLADVTSLEIFLADGDDSASFDLSALPPAALLDAGDNVDASPTTDSVTVLGTAGDDALTIDPVRAPDGWKFARLARDGRRLDFGRFESLRLDLSRDGKDSVVVDRSIGGLNRQVAVSVVGGGAGSDSLSVSSPGQAPQLVTLADGAVRYEDGHDGKSIYLGRSDNVAIDQPKAQIEVLRYEDNDGDGQPDDFDGDGVPDPVSLGPEAFNGFLLDTGATGILVTANPTSEMINLGYQTHPIQYLESGVSGSTPMDVSLPYRVDFAGESGERHTLEDFQLLSSLDVEFSFFGPWGIVGMPAMVGRVTTIDMSSWQNIEDVEDLPVKTDFFDAPPADSGHMYHVPLVLEEFPHDGQLPGGPLPTFAPLPFLDVRLREDGVEVPGRFLLDTGAQLSIISSEIALGLGLDKDGDGNLDNEALEFIEVSGIGGTTAIPLVAYDRMLLPTEEGTDLVWTDLLAGVIDIDTGDGPEISGVFGMDFLTSGWAAKVLPLLLGTPGSEEDGYFRGVSFDFRDAKNMAGTMILDLVGIHDVPTAGLANPFTVTHNLTTVEARGGSADDEFAVTPSSTVAFSVDGGPHATGDTLRLDPPSDFATDLGGRITVPGKRDILYARVEDINLDGTGEPSPLRPTLSIADASVAEGNAGTVAATFAVSLSSATDATVTVLYATSDGTATVAGRDYTATSGTLTFAPGQTSATITVSVRGDLVDELDETFSIALSAATNATIADGKGVGTILDNDSSPTVSVADAAPVADADARLGGPSEAVFAVTLSSASGRAVTVEYSTANGTATGGDYVAASGRVTFAPGETRKLVPVAIVTDGQVEPIETFALNLSAPSGATIGDGKAVGTILNDDLKVRVRAISALEGNSGKSEALFEVTLEGDVPGRTFPVSVAYATIDGTATVTGGDYLAASGVLSFPGGVSSRPLAVSIRGDASAEANETMSVVFSDPVNAALGSRSGKLTILNDDAALAIGSPEVSESAGVARFVVTLSAAMPVDVSVSYATAGGTARSSDPADFTSRRGTLVIPAGSLSGVIEVPILNDLLDEPDEQFVVRLSRPVHAVIAPGRDAGTATILDDDAAPRISIANATVTEGGAGTTTAAGFAVTLSAPSGKTITVAYATADGTATVVGRDYAAKAGTITFRPGQTTATINVTVRGDALVEAAETFGVALSSATNATIDDGSGLGRILNDDGALRLAGRALNRRRPPLTEEALAPIVDEAIRRLAIGISDAEAERLRAVRFVVADLAGDKLAGSDGATVRIDVDAAGRGWFVDATPGDDAEFRGAFERDSGRARRGSGARPRVDLLSVVMHELGHAIGLAHEDDAAGVMHGSLGVGRRARLFQGLPLLAMKIHDRAIDQLVEGRR